MVYEPEHPKAIGGGWVLEHRLVVESLLERILEQHEAVHHINGDKADNRPENLQLMDARDHAVLSLRDHQLFVRAELDELAEYRRRYGALNESATLDPVFAYMREELGKPSVFLSTEE